MWIAGCVKWGEGGAPILSELDGESKTKTISEKGIREGDLSREILLEEPQRDPVQ